MFVCTCTLYQYEFQWSDGQEHIQFYITSNSDLQPYSLLGFVLLILCACDLFESAFVTVCESSTSATHQIVCKK